jgi:hypothetical protein
VIRFDPYAVPPPLEPWEYIVDDDPIRRAPPGTAGLLEPDHPVVRLAPDTCYRSWRCEYVLVSEEEGEPRGSSPPRLNIRGALHLYARDIGADVLDFEALVTDPGGETSVRISAAASHRGAARRKVLKVLDWYRTELRLREAGQAPLLTACELFTDARPVRGVS